MLISEKKYWTMHMLEQLGYHKKYHHGILQEIVGMLTKPKQKLDFSKADANP